MVTSELTIDVNAAPTMIPTAISDDVAPGDKVLKFFEHSILLDYFGNHIA